MAWVTPPYHFITNDLLSQARLQTWEDAINASAAAVVSTLGDTVYATGANAFARLAIGGVNTVKISDGTKPVWSSSLSLTSLAVSGNATVGGTLGVAGLATFSGGIGATTFSGLVTASAGLSATTGTFSGLLTANAGLTLAAGALSLPAGAITPAMVNPTRIALKGGSLTVTSTSGTNPFAAANGGSEEADSAPIAVDGTITFTAATAGTYLYIITATGRHTDTNGSYATLRMLKNAVNIAQARQGATNTATVDAVGWALCGVLPFVNGDVVTFEITKNGSNTCVLNDVAATLVRIA